MTQFDVVSISSFSVAILSFICAVAFFLYARTSVAYFVAAAVRILSVALIVSKLKILAASATARQQDNTSFLHIAAAVAASDLMENFSFFFKTGFIGSVAGFLILMGYLFTFFSFYRAIGSFVLMTIFQKLGFRVMSGLELTYSKVAITYFSIFVGVVLSNVFGLIPFSYTITSGLGMPVTGGLIAFLMTAGALCSTSGFFSAGGLLPTGTNKKIAPLVIIIELLSFFAKFASLIIRLFANLFAGHLLLKVLYVGVFILSTLLSFMVLGVGISSFLFVSAVLSLETVLAVLQALVFLALALIYFKDARQFVYAH